MGDSVQTNVRPLFPSRFIEIFRFRRITTNLRSALSTGRDSGKKISLRVQLLVFIHLLADYYYL